MKPAGHEPVARWTNYLAGHGFSAIHWNDCGDPKVSDTDILAYADEQGYVLLTHDLDFGAILAASGDSKPSVIQLRADDLSPETIGIMVITALRQMESELREGALVTLDSRRLRLRVLPVER